MRRLPAASAIERSWCGWRKVETRMVERYIGNFSSRPSVPLMQALGAAEQAVFWRINDIGCPSLAGAGTWRPHKNELEVNSRMAIEQSTIAVCPAPAAHLLEAFRILDELGIRDYVEKQAEAHQVIEGAALPALDASLAPPTPSTTESTLGPLPPPSTLPRERRPPASLRRVKATKRAEKEGETRVARRQSGKRKG